MNEAPTGSRCRGGAGIPWEVRGALGRAGGVPTVWMQRRQRPRVLIEPSN